MEGDNYSVGGANTIWRAIERCQTYVYCERIILYFSCKNIILSPIVQLKEH